MSETDIVQEVVTTANSRYEQTATGTIEGVDVSLTRERYEKKGNRTAWKVVCETQLHSEFHANLTAVESKEYFDEYIEEYDLSVEE